MLVSSARSCAPRIAAAALLAGCAGVQMPASDRAIPPSAAAASGALLYVSLPYSNTVNFYAFPGGAKSGALKVDAPAGMCADRTGNVFVVASSTGKIVEYPHGATRPHAELTDRDEPYGCSVDLATGDLAVANRKGNVAVFSHAAGTPRTYTYPDTSDVEFCAYDGSGNLFAGATVRTKSYLVLIELPKGEKKLQRVLLPVKIRTPAPMQWDGTHLAIEKSQTSSSLVIDRLEIAGTKATIAGHVTLKAPQVTSTAMWIDGKTIVKPYEPAPSAFDVGEFKYPAGGTPQHTVTEDSHLVFGVTVSPPQ